MRPRAFLALAMLTAVALSGCSDDDGGGPADEEIVDRDAFELESGKGAILGLLVDDRFRPIHLTDDPVTEFDAAGFILLQETGQEARTTQNGEFQFVNLAPGTYTVRVQAEGHEAAPTRVTVQAGEFAEQSVVARRTLSEGSFILTQEFTIWSDCWVVLVVVKGNEMNCYQDYSGDSLIGGFQVNYSALAGQMTYLVTEALVDRPGYYDILVGVTYEGDALIDDVYAEAIIRDGDYVKIVNEVGVIWEEGGRSDIALDNETLQYPVLVTNFPRDRFRDELNDAGWPFLGAEAGLAVKTKVVQSAFLGAPEVDLDAYCVLC